ncbi:DNA polymerase beta domain protein region [Candidatus Vecturithrix granuli]|uniref:DNA polymerase beta domain protein region n=1 Tax=Vecturithrix granuli TaxID=1499967 RepID=A0A081C5L3_VECG1|nr:DNA polymerase beta domain protein region [Candidatus Vecturithrix granuli]
MLSPQHITKTLRQQYPYLTKTYGLKRIGVFGSYAKGFSHEQSDIDLVAEFETPIGIKFVEFTEYLEHLFQTSVDVLTPTGIQSIRNKRIAKDIQESILYV